jgi:hypothetical protein
MDRKRKEKPGEELPQWLRIFLLIVAFAYLFWVLFFKDGQQPQGFPSFRGR